MLVGIYTRLIKVRPDRLVLGVSLDQYEPVADYWLEQMLPCCWVQDCSFSMRLFPHSNKFFIQPVLICLGAREKGTVHLLRNDPREIVNRWLKRRPFRLHAFAL